MCSILLRGSLSTKPPLLGSNSVFCKGMHLKQKLIISIPFVIRNVGNLLQVLYDHYFAIFLQNYEAKLTENELLASLYNKFIDVITKILLLSAKKAQYKHYF